MPKVLYQKKRFGQDALGVISHADRILTSYAGRGFTLTLRQLYYQFVSQGLIPNNDREYKRLGTIVNDARLAGLLDWSHMEDRTRNLKRSSAWSSPADIINSAAVGYHRDWWAPQDAYVEVWIEKDALVGVIQPVCEELSVPYFSCRGYTSQSEMWASGQRLGAKLRQGKRVIILHLGDHDPSGIDMSRDIEERLRNFLLHDEARRLVRVGVEQPTLREDLAEFGDRFEVRRIALTMEQIREVNPPPNPAKLTDARAAGYIELYGDESWELDALTPEYISELIREEVEGELDLDLWQEEHEREEREREQLTKAARRWSDVVGFLGDA